MRVLPSRLLAVLDPEATRQRSGSKAGPSPLGSARSTGSNRPGVASVPVLSANRVADAARRSSATTVEQCSTVSDNDECSAFDLLHTEKGCVAFEQWYQRILTNGSAAKAAALPRLELGLMWPQAFCPQNALHEHAFMELIRVFVECSDSEAFDLFDIMDHDYLGFLGYAQVYISICLVAALGSRQLTKFFYFHSTRVFGILSRGCRVSSAPGCISWPRLLLFLRLLGAQGSLISRVGTENGITPLAQLDYEDFLETVYPIVVELDRGGEFGEITVINESDKIGNVQLMSNVRSRACAIL